MVWVLSYLKVDNGENEFNIKASLKVFFVQRVIQSSKRFNLWITSSVFRVSQAILILFIFQITSFFYEKIPGLS